MTKLPRSLKKFWICKLNYRRYFTNQNLFNLKKNIIVNSLLLTSFVFLIDYETWYKHGFTLFFKYSRYMLITLPAT